MEDKEKILSDQDGDTKQFDLGMFDPKLPKPTTFKHIYGNIKHLCLSLFVGQLLAGLLGASAVCAALLSREGFNLPLIQNLPHYLLLFLLYGAVQLVSRNRHLRANGTELTTEEVSGCLTRFGPAICYTIAGCIDLHALWATLAAYAYTNVTSIQLLDCLGIPTAMLLSHFLLRYRYSWTHYVGAVICLTGAMLMIGADVLTSKRQNMVRTGIVNASINPDRTDVIIGDMFAVLGAVLYGISSALQEYVTNRFGPCNYLTWFSIAAALFCTFYGSILEHSNLSELVYTGHLRGQRIPMIALAYYLGYSICMFTMDSIMAFVIQRISAVFVNLSLLTADLWALLAGIWLFHVQFHYLYFVSFILIMTGATIFSFRNAKNQSGEQL
ncbi:unnamed protein product [Echinostoma caproni]|uniref:Solute carrier family 35 member F1 n=1 Tax=Echinostoma caproni TaxID=27848 RepID=A0A183AJN8_9TREM|nr:unnamed protein product [Echinostoma caproni]